METARTIRQRHQGTTTTSTHVGLAVFALAALACQQTGGINGPATADASAMIPYSAMPSDAPRPIHRQPLLGPPPNPALAQHLARHYRIASEAAETMVGISFDAGSRIGLDPLLILAVIAVESRFNPFAGSDVGARGLMQVIPKYHWDQFGTHDAEHALYPIANIRAGARVLKDYIDRTGSLVAGLQKYNGAQWDEGSHYAQKVLEERTHYAQIMQIPATALQPDPMRGANRAAQIDKADDPPPVSYATDLKRPM